MEKKTTKNRKLVQLKTNSDVLLKTPRKKKKSQVQALRSLHKMLTTRIRSLFNNNNKKNITDSTPHY